jgi:hypothetical protein
MISEIIIDVDLVGDETPIHHFEVGLPDQIATVALGQTKPLEVQFLGEDIVISTFVVQDAMGPPGGPGPPGPPGPPGSGIFSLITNETPTGAINGVNTGFMTSQLFQGLDLIVYLNGLRQRIDQDFTILNANTFTMTAPPLMGDTINVDYIPQ